MYAVLYAGAATRARVSEVVFPQSEVALVVLAAPLGYLCDGTVADGANVVWCPQSDSVL